MLVSALDVAEVVTCPDDPSWILVNDDVVVFYTTYKVNAYDMPFGIFVSVNNHGKTIFFGCALLSNETISAFRWLMKVLYLSYKFVQLFFHFI